VNLGAALLRAAGSAPADPALVGPEPERFGELATSAGRLAARVAAMVMYYDEDFRDEPIRVCEDRATITNADRAMQLGVRLPEVSAAPAAAPAKAEMSPAEPAKPAPATTPAQPEVTPK